ncbi:hypothetical protein [Marinoscillum sp.]|uniref:hypothetical protein n=1 Tax=Marinoscillum sp. TaxID=2024838 RepID=UPI003BAC155F
MKLAAYTLIEGIVTMVILSILLTAISIISFNVYRSYPSGSTLLLQNRVNASLDSMIQKKHMDLRLWSAGGIDYTYRTRKYDRFETIYRARLVGVDSLGKEYVTSGIFYVMDDED